MPDDTSAARSPVGYQILLALAGRDRHGYLIRKAVEQQTEGEMTLGPGTLYAALRRLEDAGLVEESPWRPDPDLDDSRRRYYRLTKTGRVALQAETSRLQATVKLALRALATKPAR